MRLMLLEPTEGDDLLDDDLPDLLTERQRRLAALGLEDDLLPSEEEEDEG